MGTALAIALVAVLSAGVLLAFGALSRAITTRSSRRSRRRDTINR